MSAPVPKQDVVYSRWVHWLTVALTVIVFLLIGFGTLVTTLDAGMAVPDWPGTYGYNMFLYPVSTWLFGPFDLLAEHSHRLMGSLAGIVTIALCVAAWRYEARGWVKWWTIGLLVAVIAQGVLGGVRVLLDDRTFAMVHGCTGPLFFAIVAATAVITSRWWHHEQDLDDVGQYATGLPLACLATLLTVVSYGQLVVGAQLRHVTGLTSHRAFTGIVHLHLGLAVLLLVLALALVVATWLGRFQAPKVRFISRLVGVFVLIQVGLGVATWFVNYAFPISEMSPELANYTIQAKGYWESAIVTGHAATGSLILACSCVCALRSWRTRRVASVIASQAT